MRQGLEWLSPGTTSPVTAWGGEHGAGVVPSRQSAPSHAIPELHRDTGYPAGLIALTQFQAYLWYTQTVAKPKQVHKSYFIFCVIFC